MKAYAVQGEQRQIEVLCWIETSSKLAYNVLGLKLIHACFVSYVYTVYTSFVGLPKY